jgi:MATE family multidrug resistance protein
MSDAAARGGGGGESPAAAAAAAGAARGAARPAGAPAARGAREACETSSADGVALCEDAGGDAAARRACGAVVAVGVVPTALEEALAQARLAAPLCVFNFLQFSITAVSVAVVGRTGSVPMAAAALASSFTNVAGMSFVIGASLTLETTCSQAHGAGEHAALGVSLTRAWVLNAALCALATALWCAAAPFFRALRQDATLAALAGAYARACIPHAWLVGAQIPLQKVLQAQGVNTPFSAIGATLLICHTFTARALVARSGFLGAASALCVTDALALALTAGVYGVREWRTRPAERTWPGVASGEALRARGWAPFLRLAAPNVAMLVVEWSTFEIVTLLSGLLPGAETGAPTAASAIAFTTIMVSFSLPLGLSNAASARVGAALGAGAPAAARAAARAAGAAVLACVSAIAALLACFGGGAYGKLFTGGGAEGAPALASFRAVLPALVFLVFGDGCQCVLSGVVRGAGAQAVAARLNFVCYYCIGLPLGATLAFGARVGLVGLWTGLAVATNAQALALLLFLRRMDWAAAAERAQAQAAGDGGGGDVQLSAAKQQQRGGAASEEEDERRGLLASGDEFADEDAHGDVV